ncbi:hypothetical protein ACFWAP_06730 [Streptomyces goshikiensis]|uniref:hypothetical protein n=1 Tax=Streptomyces goshikiensis TaxID=1942 RepID=UPI003660C81B
MNPNDTTPPTTVGLANRFKRWALASAVVAAEAVQHIAEPGTDWVSDADRVQTWAIWALGVQLVVTGTVVVTQKLKNLEFIEFRLGRKSQDHERSRSETGRRRHRSQGQQSPIRDSRPPTRRAGDGGPATGSSGRGPRRDQPGHGQGGGRGREDRGRGSRQPERDAHEGA